MATHLEQVGLELPPRGLSNGAQGAGEGADVWGVTESVGLHFRSVQLVPRPAFPYDAVPSEAIASEAKAYRQMRRIRFERGAGLSAS